MDLLGDLSIAPAVESNINPEPVIVSKTTSSSVDPFGLDDFGGMATGASVTSDTSPAVPSLPLLLPAAQNKGLSIYGEIKKLNSQLNYHLSLKNESQTVIDGFMIQFNMNTFGLTPINQV